MLMSLGLVFIVGITLKAMFEKIKLPGLIGLMASGILLGPFVLNVLSLELLDLSDVLREIALIVIIFRAGLNLDLNKLLRNKITVILLSFLPATFEIGAIILLGPLLLNLSVLDSAILGCIISAVSPAVIVPNMIKVISEGYGNDKGIGQMIMSAASVDDIYVITIFLALLNVKSGGSNFSVFVLLTIVTTIVTGIVFGIIVGRLFNKFMSKINFTTEYLFLVTISILFLMNQLESILEPYVGFSSLLAIMAFGATIEHKDRLLKPFESVWFIFEILLFTLIGSQLNLNYLFVFGLYPLLLIVGSLIIRSLGVITALFKSSLNMKEKVFVTMSFIPKATVQAAIGPIPLMLGFESGELILTVAIIAILITAPLGSFLINKFYRVLLKQSA